MKKYIPIVFFLIISCASQTTKTPSKDANSEKNDENIIELEKRIKKLETLLVKTGEEIQELKNLEKQTANLLEKPISKPLAKNNQDTSNIDTSEDTFTKTDLSEDTFTEDIIDSIFSTDISGDIIDSIFSTDISGDIIDSIFSTDISGDFFNIGVSSDNLKNIEIEFYESSAREDFKLEFKNSVLEKIKKWEEL